MIEVLHRKNGEKVFFFWLQKKFAPNMHTNARLNATTTGYQFRIGTEKKEQKKTGRNDGIRVEINFQKKRYSRYNDAD